MNISGRAISVWYVTTHPRHTRYCQRSNSGPTTEFLSLSLCYLEVVVYRNFGGLTGTPIMDSGNEVRTKLVTVFRQWTSLVSDLELRYACQYRTVSYVPVMLSIKGPLFNLSRHYALCWRPLKNSAWEILPSHVIT